MALCTVFTAELAARLAVNEIFGVRSLLKPFEGENVIERFWLSPGFPVWKDETEVEDIFRALVKLIDSLPIRRDEVDDGTKDVDKVEDCCLIER